MPTRHFSNKDIEKMKALAKRYEYMFDRHLKRRDEWLSKWNELLDIALDILIKERDKYVNSKESQEKQNGKE